ncbi:MAG: hypothetical protein V4625_12820 [Pseudomonadota bacterium]
MLAIPSKGFRRSLTAHNIDLSICCDWIESSVFFLQEELTDADVVDVLRENELYATQDFAWEFVNDAFSHIRDRARLFGHGYPIEFQSKHRLRARGTVEAYGAYGFCLVLSLPGAYPKWAKNFGQDFNEQGELFEKLTAESVAASLSGWTVHSTGWSRTATKKLKAVVDEVASLLGEGMGDIYTWTRDSANEAGLDLLCFRPFPDGRVGVPVYLVQCASGANWEQKLRTPDLRIWNKLVTFAAEPKKAFSMPYALQERDFTRHTNVVDGLLLDRHRLLAPGKASINWLTPALNKLVSDWSIDRIATLPLLEPIAV